MAASNRPQAERDPARHTKAAALAMGAGRHARAVASSGPVLSMVVIYAALVYGVIRLGPRGPAACDSDVWAGCDEISHIQQIDYFIAHPASLFHYPATTATTPGFHILIGWLARIGGNAEIAADTWLRGVPAILGLAVLGMLWVICRASSNDTSRATLLCLPILFSKYFLLSSAYLLTDMAGYFGYVLLLFLYLIAPGQKLLIGAAGAGLVFCRQIYLAVVLTPCIEAAATLSKSLRRSELWALALSIAPPIALAAAYVVLWGGLVPPVADARLHLSGTLFSPILNPAPLVEAWSLFGLLAVPYGLLVCSALGSIVDGRCVRRLAVASLLATAVWVLVPSSFDGGAAASGDPGRWGSIVWWLAKWSPTVADRAILVLPCLVLGFNALALALEVARSRRCFPVEFAMYALYTGSLCLQSYSFQRYTEVVALITLSVTCSRLTANRTGAALFATAYAMKLPLTLLLQLGR